MGSLLEQVYQLVKDLDGNYRCYQAMQQRRLAYTNPLLIKEMKSIFESFLQILQEIQELFVVKLLPFLPVMTVDTPAAATAESSTGTIPFTEREGIQRFCSFNFSITVEEAKAVGDCLLTDSVESSLLLSTGSSGQEKILFRKLLSLVQLIISQIKRPKAVPISAMPTTSASGTMLKAQTNLSVSEKKKSRKRGSESIHLGMDVFDKNLVPTNHKPKRSRNDVPNSTPHDK